MSTAALVALLAAATHLVMVTLGNERPQRLATVMLPAMAVAVGWQLLSDGLLLSYVPVYVLIALTSFVQLLRLAGGRLSRIDGQRLWPRLLLVIVSLPLAAVPMVEATILPLEVDDYRHHSWSVAFDRLHSTLQNNYGFSRWKRIDWDQLYAVHAPMVAAAEERADAEAYYTAVRSYLFEIPDGHIGIDGDQHDAARLREIGGGFGFAVQPLADGIVIADLVIPESPAARAGMSWGAEILEWDGTSIDEAVATTEILWFSRPPATVQTVSVAQHQLVVRGPVGAVRKVVFRNPGDSIPRTATLSAYNDDYVSLRDGPLERETEYETLRPVWHKLLDGQLGYVRIAGLETPAGGVGPVEAMEQAMEELSDATALILDVRGNRGGLDHLVPAMMGYFTDEPLLYENIAGQIPIFNKTINLFSLTVQPNRLRYTQPVVVLVDHRTKSSGEGFALIAKQLPNMSVLGMEGTDGSFGMAGASVRLPTGISVVYPWGLSLDGDSIVQVDGDHQLRGGVHPDIIVPLTFELVKASHSDDRDIVLEAAIDELLGLGRHGCGDGNGDSC